MKPVEQPASKIAVIGLGNTLRGDDAAGSYVCGQLSLLALPQTDVFELHQMQVEQAGMLVQYDHIIVVDASMQHAKVELERVSPTHLEGSNGTASSHFMELANLAQLAARLYSEPLANIYRCGIPAHHFVLGEPPTAEVMHRCQDAVSLIQSFISNAVGDSSSFK